MTVVALTLDEGESLIAGEDELVYRQITKHLMHNGSVATHAFTGTTADAGKPSYSRSTVVGPQDSRDWHTANAKSPSLGVWAVSVGEVELAGTHAVDDSRTPIREGERRSPGHCYVDARIDDRLALKVLRASLWEAAMQRGEVPTSEPRPDGQLDVDIDSED